MSTQIKRLRDQVETFVHDKVNPTVERATVRIISTVDTSSRLDALIAVLVEKGVITEEELKRHAKSAALATSHPRIWFHHPRRIRSNACPSGET